MTRIEASGRHPGLHLFERTEIGDKTGAGSAMETAAAVEIDQGCLRRHFLYRFPQRLGKACWLFHSFHSAYDYDSYSVYLNK